MYTITKFSRDLDGGYIANCPHCGDTIGIEGEDSTEILGEVFLCRCGQEFEVDYNAVFVRRKI